MRRAFGTRLGTTAITALMLLALGGTLGLASLGGTGLVRTSVGPTVSHDLRGVAPFSSAPPRPANASIQVFIDSSPPLYAPVPLNLNFHITTNVTVIGASDPTNQSVFLWVQVVDATPLCTLHYSSRPTYDQCPTVAIWSLNGSVASGQTAYNATIDLANLSTQLFRSSCPHRTPCTYTFPGNTFPDDPYLIVIWANAFDAVTNTTGVGYASRTVYLITQAPTGVLIAPSTTSQISIGNHSVVVQYNGSYLNGANVTIYSPGSTSTIAYQQGVFQVGQPGNKTVAGASVWTVTTPGTYAVKLTISTQYHTSVDFWNNVTVSSSGGTVYQNSTVWKNSSGGLIPGLGSGATGALLLVVGLIIGMIVALALGRAMWGGPKSAPAQPWSAKPTNECPICHQTFGTEAEMKEHQKTAHGMQV